MIEMVIELLAILILVAAVVVIIIALAVGAMLGVISLRILKKVHTVVGWLRWPKSEK